MLTLLLMVIAANMAGDGKERLQFDDGMIVTTSQPKDSSVRRVDENWEMVRNTVKEFNHLDTNYIEPQHYDFTVMMQATSSYDFFIIRSSDGQRFMLTPDLSLKLGPYFGWRWIFLGYTFDLKNIGFSGGKIKREFVFSIYSSKIGVDMFYRRTGNDYKLRDVRLGGDIDDSKLQNMPFAGVTAGITGIDAYYIFNHRHFSYPAAFSQSTLQKISCGSFIAGAGYTRNSLSLDYDNLQQVIDKTYGAGTVKLDSGLMIPKVKYHDISLSAGYAYNFVLPHHWLIGLSGQVALAYKKSTGDSAAGGVGGFQFENVNIDGIGRIGLVYNNMRWYVGSSLIVHTNNYRKAQFYTNNIFGSLNIYVGYNFKLKKKYRKT